jgi:hypothetical protein
LKSNIWRWPSVHKCKDVPMSEFCQFSDRSPRNIPIPWAVGAKKIVSPFRVSELVRFYTELSNISNQSYLPQKCNCFPEFHEFHEFQASRNRSRFGFAEWPTDQLRRPPVGDIVNILLHQETQKITLDMRKFSRNKLPIISIVRRVISARLSFRHITH